MQIVSRYEHSGFTDDFAKGGVEFPGISRRTSSNTKGEIVHHAKAR